MKNVICPACGGDGKETCSNPDHGFLTGISFLGANESNCPCCGHDPKHKIPNGGSCEPCNGTGRLSETEFFMWAVNNNYDNAAEYAEKKPR